MKDHILNALLAVALVALPGYPQSASGSGSPEVNPTPPVDASVTPIKTEHSPDKRLFGVLPNYRTVSAEIPFTRLTARQKLGIASRDSFDWPTYQLAAFLTFVGEMKANGTWPGFANRYVRTSADQIIGNMLTEAFMPILLREDPRYFRPGIGTFWSRPRSAVTQIAVAHNDTGHLTFNASEVLGNAMAVGISNSYSPNLRSWSGSTEKLGLMIGTDMFSNVIKEFGPDIKEHLWRRHHHGT